MANHPPPDAPSTESFLNEVDAKKLSIALFGVGAMGVLFGSRLARFAQVTLIGNWPAQIEAVNRDGLRVTHVDGAESHAPLHLTSQLETIGKVDLAIVLVKSYQTLNVAQRVNQILKPTGLAITLQNGLGNVETVRAALGTDRVTLGVTAQGANIVAPGHLCHAGEGETYLADLGSRGSLIVRTAGLLNRSDLPTEVVPAARAASLVWGKLAVNAGINPLSALFDSRTGGLLEDERLRQAMVAAARETAAVAAAQDITLPYPNAGEQVLAVARATAANYSSMLQDIRRGAPTEIDAICGAVARAGTKHGVATPLNSALDRLVRARQNGERLSRAELFAALDAITADGNYADYAAHR